MNASCNVGLLRVHEDYYGIVCKISCLAKIDVEYCRKITFFSVPEVVWQWFIGEVGKLVAFQCRFCLKSRVQNVFKIS